jgi:hypothetical protein
MNETTYRYPRTLQEAFGPDAHGGQVVPMDAPEPMPKADKIVTIASIIGLVVVAVMAVAGWLPGGAA